MTVLLAIDGGTESLRAAAFTLDGQCLGMKAAPYPVHFLPGGRAEQRPADWWSALATAVGGLLGETGIDPARIEAVCLDTTCCTLLPVDRDGKPLCDALMWMDVRGASEAAEVSATHDPFLQVNGGGETAVQAEWMIPKALWLKRNAPDIYRRAATIYEYQDHLNRLLTGRITGSKSGMVGRWHYLPDRGGWPSAIFSAVGLEDIVEKLPRDILGPGELVGPLLPQAAAALGLKAGTPVIQGGADAYLAVIGMGVAAPGEMALVTGSSHLLLAVTDRPFHRKGVLGTFRDAVYAGRWIADGGLTSSGSALAWLRSTAAPAMSFESLSAEAAKAPVGCDGLIALDHLQGNRSPYSDPLARGAFVGMSLDHTISHLARAMMEAVCFGTRLIVDNYEESLSIDRVVACGGATKSPFWMQMHADTLNKTIEVPAFLDAPLMGCAIVAAVGLGHYADIDRAAAAMVRIDQRYVPDPRNARRYQAIYRSYVTLYHALRDWRNANSGIQA